MQFYHNAMPTSLASLKERAIAMLTAGMFTRAVAVNSIFILLPKVISNDASEIWQYILPALQPSGLTQKSSQQSQQSFHMQ